MCIGSGTHVLTHQIDQSENYVHNAGKSSHIRQLLHGRNEAARFVGSVRVLTELVEEERFQIVIHIDVARHLMGSVSHISHFLVLHKALVDSIATNAIRMDVAHLLLLTIRIESVTSSNVRTTPRLSVTKSCIN